MTVKITRPSIDIRGTLDELNKPSGIAGNAMLAAETPQEQFNLIGAGRKNLLINSEFRVNQRGNTSFSGIAGAYGYLSDRWITYANGVAISASVYSVTLPDGTVANSLKTVATTAASSFFHPYQRVETYGRDFLNGKKVVLSAWVRTNAPNQFFRLCDTVECYALGDEIPSDGEWHKLSVVHTLRTNLNTGATNFMQFHPAFGVSALAVGDYVEFALPQMELGSVATPFEHRSYGEELALCQRYYYEITDAGQPAYSAVLRATSGSGIQQYSQEIFLPVIMRVTPMVVITYLDMHKPGVLYDAINYVDIVPRTHSVGFRFSVANPHPQSIACQVRDFFISLDAEL